MCTACMCWYVAGEWRCVLRMCVGVLVCVAGEWRCVLRTCVDVLVLWDI